jgi:hypothetical protein
MGRDGLVRATTVMVAAVVLLTAGAALAHGTWTPPEDTIVTVTGTRRDGFQVRYHDQRTAYLPTISEALAECSEYDERIARVRCKVGVRTWYRDLGDTKRAIRYARRY